MVLNEATESESENSDLVGPSPTCDSASILSAVKKLNFSVSSQSACSTSRHKSTYAAPITSPAIKVNSSTERDLTHDVPILPSMGIETTDGDTGAAAEIGRITCLVSEESEDSNIVKPMLPSTCDSTSILSVVEKPIVSMSSHSASPTHKSTYAAPTASPAIEFNSSTERDLTHDPSILPSVGLKTTAGDTGAATTAESVTTHRVSEDSEVAEPSPSTCESTSILSVVKRPSTLVFSQNVFPSSRHNSTFVVATTSTTEKVNSSTDKVKTHDATFLSCVGAETTDRYTGAAATAETVTTCLVSEDSDVVEPSPGSTSVLSIVKKQSASVFSKNVCPSSRHNSTFVAPTLSPTDNVNFSTERNLTRDAPVSPRVEVETTDGDTGAAANAVLVTPCRVSFTGLAPPPVTQTDPAIGLSPIHGDSSQRLLLTQVKPRKKRESAENNTRLSSSVVRSPMVSFYEYPTVCEPTRLNFSATSSDEEKEPTTLVKKRMQLKKHAPSSCQVRKRLGDLGIYDTRPVVESVSYR